VPRAEPSRDRRSGWSCRIEGQAETCSQEAGRQEEIIPLSDEKPCFGRAFFFQLHTMPESPQAVDCIIDARWVIPVEPAGIILERHSVVVAMGDIVDVLPSELAACATRQNGTWSSPTTC